jgi:hypothetical protein
MDHNRGSERAPTDGHSAGKRGQMDPNRVFSNAGSQLGV